MSRSTSSVLCRSLCLISLHKDCIVTTKYIASGQASRVRGRITPNFGCPISASSDQFPSFCGVMLRPCYNFVVYLRGRIRFEGFGLPSREAQMAATGVHGSEQLTSRMSQAQMEPFSSPATTLASPCPKQARHRYEVWAWPEKSLSNLPVMASMRRMCPSRVITR